ncbi:hypothetical protein WN72_21225 [Bradyrhizobium arachidis]|uniref:Uncharacterized protein n=1 Tax=Bradyrhizobium arachidis TaxID=858423 RepID=A0AAE7THK0_9BRAD|nr:hypothetical protein WN72_21225 [Bradyrhizobium arachidis]
MGEIDPIRDRHTRHKHPKHVDEDDGIRVFRGLLIGGAVSLLLWLCIAVTFTMIVKGHLFHRGERTSIPK